MAKLKRKLELYEELFKTFGPGESKTQLNDLSELWHVSTRHTSTLLQQFTDLNWLTWTAERGRSKQATLVLFLEPIDACYSQLGPFVESGDVDQLLDVLSFGQRDAQSQLQQYLATENSRKRPKVYIPFHRTISTLNVLESKRRTERFLITQVYQRLTRVVTRNDSTVSSEVTGDLAYHWTSSSDATLWRFQLRNQVLFHHGQNLTANDVCICLNALVTHPYWRRSYNHIQNAKALTNDVIEVTLTRPDWHLPRLFARPEASIYQFSHTTKCKLWPIGSGPFSLEVASQRILRLKRNPNYCHQTSIVDQVELWVHPGWQESKACSANQLCLRLPEATRSIPCVGSAEFYLITNPQNTNLPLFYEDTSESKQLSLAQERNHSSATQIEYAHYHDGQGAQVVSLIDENDPFGVWLNFLWQFPFSNLALGSAFISKINDSLQEIQSEPDFEQAVAMLRALKQDLVDQRILRPLKTESFELNISTRLNGVVTNGYGWAELANLWIEDSQAAIK